MIVTLNGDRSRRILLEPGRFGRGNAVDRFAQQGDRPSDLVESQVVRFKSSDGLSIPSILYNPSGVAGEQVRPWLGHGGPADRLQRLYRPHPVLVNHGSGLASTTAEAQVRQTFFTADDRKHAASPARLCRAKAISRDVRHRP